MIINTQLNDGTPICIRAVSKIDEQRLKDGIAKLSPQSRYLRFFSGMERPPQRVIDALVDVDGHDHIAWGAIRTDIESKPALGVVHAFRDDDHPDTAEFSVAVLDEYHGLGLGRLLAAVILLDCRREGLERLAVHILPNNRPALLFAKSLGGHETGNDTGDTEIEILIEEAILTLQANNDITGLGAVFAQFDAEQ
ncbi:GNAT family N-acetyltransferase [Altererythrobacter aquiaggeris]|uniref:GNAT family N-acetyltransferase n=1 Tax=Aestuarierythrobacter aquiaggeris TaxID=1898396 RepID=UPI003017EBBD